jgi:hypothetical protein
LGSGRLRRLRRWRNLRRETSYKENGPANLNRQQASTLLPIIRHPAPVRKVSNLSDVPDDYFSGKAKVGVAATTAPALFREYRRSSAILKGIAVPASLGTKHLVELPAWQHRISILSRLSRRYTTAAQEAILIVTLCP